MLKWFGPAVRRTGDALKQAFTSPAIWFFIACYLAATVYTIVTDGLEDVLTTTALQAGYFVLLLFTIFITVPMPQQDQVENADSRRLVWDHLAIILFFILLTGYTGLAFYNVIPKGAANIPLWTPLMTAVGSFGAIHLPVQYFRSPSSSLMNPVSYFVIPLLVLMPMSARLAEFGFGRGHRAILVTLLWCGVEVGMWAMRIAGGTLTPLRLEQVLIGNFFQNGFFEEFLFRGALQTRLRLLLDPAWALVLASLLFGLWHLGTNVNQSGGDWLAGVALCIRSQAVLGLVFGVIFMRTRNLLACSIVHVVLNTFFTV